MSRGKRWEQHSVWCDLLITPTNLSLSFRCFLSLSTFQLSTSFSFIFWDTHGPTRVNTAINSHLPHRYISIYIYANGFMELCSTFQELEGKFFVETRILQWPCSSSTDHRFCWRSESWSHVQPQGVWTNHVHTLPRCFVVVKAPKLRWFVKACPKPTSAQQSTKLEREMLWWLL